MLGDYSKFHARQHPASEVEQPAGNLLEIRPDLSVGCIGLAEQPTNRHRRSEELLRLLTPRACNKSAQGIALGRMILLEFALPCRGRTSPGVRTSFALTGEEAHVVRHLPWAVPAVPRAGMLPACGRREIATRSFQNANDSRLIATDGTEKTAMRKIHTPKRYLPARVATCRCNSLRITAIEGAPATPPNCPPILEMWPAFPVRYAETEMFSHSGRIAARWRLLANWRNRAA